MNDREKFEEVYWSKHGGDVIKKPFRREANKYFVPYVEACWFIWQAATAESAARIAKLENALEYLIDTCPPIDPCGEEAHQRAKAITNTRDKT